MPSIIARALILFEINGRGEAICAPPAQKLKKSLGRIGLIISITNSRKVSVHVLEKKERLLVVYENGTNLYDFRSPKNACLC